MNPINSSATNGQQVGVSPSNPINDPNFSSRQGSNTFDLSYQNLLTARYGEITPFFAMSALGRDRIELRSSIDLRTYTLAAPLMSQVRLKKSFFSVPMKAIMPNSWDYLFVNPVKGNDVPDDAYCFVDLLELAHAVCSSGIKTTSAGIHEIHTFRAFMLVYLIFSKGGLLDYLGISTSQFVDGFDFGEALRSYPSTQDMTLATNSIDGLFDALCDWLLFGKEQVNVELRYHLDDFTKSSSASSLVIKDLKTGKFDRSYLRDFFYTFFQHPEASLVTATGGNNGGFTSFCTVLSNTMQNLITYLEELSNNGVSCNVNLYKVIAYHMAVSQFYSNDHVDNVYSASLWLDNMRSLIYKVSRIQQSDTFVLNGVPVRYDVFSNHFLMLLVNDISDLAPGSTYADELMCFWYNLFTFRNSLRYGDYFNSSRPQPLAVGDVNVPVVGSNVSVIDINKNLHIQRFLNAVNRVGSNIVDYAKGIFGYRPQAVDPAPNFISEEYFIIGKDEIDNNADDQGTVNTNLVSQDSRFAFDVNITDPSIIIGLCSFEVLGAYPYTIEKDNFHRDRYDMFNPFLQHIGDQKVSRLELGFVDSEDVPFGYQVRYAEYKFRYPQQHGGFNDQGCALWSLAYKNRTDFLSEDFIRSYPVDFDKFYKSLAYCSLANYFHFQISFQNSVQANRAMDYQPTLLG